MLEHSAARLVERLGEVAASSSRAPATSTPGTRSRVNGSRMLAPSPGVEHQHVVATPSSTSATRAELVARRRRPRSRPGRRDPERVLLGLGARRPASSSALAAQRRGGVAVVDALERARSGGRSSPARGAGGARLPSTSSVASRARTRTSRTAPLDAERAARRRARRPTVPTRTRRGARSRGVSISSVTRAVARTRGGADDRAQRAHGAAAAADHLAAVVGGHAAPRARRASSSPSSRTDDGLRLVDQPRDEVRRRARARRRALQTPAILRSFFARAGGGLRGLAPTPERARARRRSR